MPWWAFYLVGIFLKFAIIQPIFQLAETSSSPFVEHEILYLVLASLILAPLLETAIFQLGIVELTTVCVKKIFNNDLPLLGIILSALVFSLQHPYSIVYVIVAFLTGLFFAIMYYSFRVRNGVGYAYWMTMVFHVLWNLLTFVLTNLFP